MYLCVHTICRRVVANVWQSALLLRYMDLFGVLFHGLCGPDVPRHTICLLAKSRVPYSRPRRHCTLLNENFFTDHTTFSSLMRHVSSRYTYMKFFALKINPIFFSSSPPHSRGKRKEPPGAVFERDRELASARADRRGERSKIRETKGREKKGKERKKVAARRVDLPRVYR